MWNVSRDGASTASLGNLCQCPITLTVKSFFLISSRNLPSFSLNPLLLVLPQQGLLKSPLYVLQGRNKISSEPSLFQAEQSQLCQPFLIGEVIQPSDHFCGLLWTASDGACLSIIHIVILTNPTTVKSCADLNGGKDSRFARFGLVNKQITCSI